MVINSSITTYRNCDKSKYFDVKLIILNLKSDKLRPHYIYC